MIRRPYDRARPAELELELREARARRLEAILMVAAETLCAIAGVAAFLAFARHEVEWSAILAASSASSYLVADLIERG